MNIIICILAILGYIACYNMHFMFGDLTISDVKFQIGTLIKSLRKKQGLTQLELGEKLQLSRITIQNLESGKNATLDTLLTVLQYFDKLYLINDIVMKEINDNDVESLY